VFQFLELRNDITTHEYRKKLKDLIDAAVSGTKDIAQINEEISAQSHKARIATLITLAYAPAGVIAVGQSSPNSAG
jgi:hypothetical protein